MDIQLHCDKYTPLYGLPHGFNQTLLIVAPPPSIL